MSEMQTNDTTCDAGFSDQIDQLVLEETVAPKQMAKLKEHLGGCSSCQQRYNKVVLAVRLLNGGPDALAQPSKVELSRVREQVLSRARLAPEPPVRHSLLKWIGGLAAVGAALAIIIPMALEEENRAPVETEPAFQARGGAAKAGKAVGLRLFCLERNAGASIVEIDGDKKKDCPLGATLKFAYTNRSKFSQLAVVGVTADFSLRWYLPRSPKGSSIAIKASVVDEPLERSVKLAVNHQAGPLRVFAIFSNTVITAASLNKAVAAAKQKGSRLETLELLPVDDTEQRSIFLRLDKSE